MLIVHALNKEQATALFDENAVMQGSSDVIYDYRIAELFGPEVCEWAESCMGADHFLQCGPDWSMWGDGGCHYFTRSGYNKIVSHHNYLVCHEEYEASEGGKLWARLWKARHDRMDAEEAEEERKRQERKAKRIAARKAKEEAQEKEQDAAV